MAITNEKNFIFRWIIKSAINFFIKALIIFGDGINPDLLFEDELSKISEKLDVLVYANHLKNKIFDIADYVIPTKTYAEQESTVINLAGKIKNAPKMIKNHSSNLLSIWEISEKIFENKKIDIENSPETFISKI